MRFLNILYKILLFILIPIILPVGFLIALKKKEDADFFERLGFVTFPEPPEKCVWFHCASVGEVRSIQLITDMIKAEMPELKIIISTTTATGKAEARKLIQPYHAFLLPLENGRATAHIIDYMNVKALIFIDTELWPLFIQTAAKHAKLFLLNARISERTVKSYLRFRFIFGTLLGKFEKIYTKSDEDTARFASVTGRADNIATLGNIKFQTRKDAPAVEIFDYIKNHGIFAAASTHPGEEEAVIEAFKANKACDRLVIAPRHINRSKDIAAMAAKAGLTVSLLSENNRDTQCVVADRFGALEELYVVSDKIFVGGSLDTTGGHNIYEALQFRKPVIVGSNMANFKEIYDQAARHGAVTTVADAAELAEALDADSGRADFDGLFAEVDAGQKHVLDAVREVIRSVYTY